MNITCTALLICFYSIYTLVYSCGYIVDIWALPFAVLKQGLSDLHVLFN